jgi:hypothetical protein
MMMMSKQRREMGYMEEKVSSGVWEGVGDLMTMMMMVVVLGCKCQRMKSSAAAAAAAAAARVSKINNLRVEVLLFVVVSAFTWDLCGELELDDNEPEKIVSAAATEKDGATVLEEVPIPID